MKRRTVLVQWIGHSDLRAMAATLSETQRKRLLDRIGGDAPKSGDRGPTKTLLETRDFDEVRLLSNESREWNESFLSWPGVKAELVAVELAKPTDYGGIYRIADQELAAIRQRKTSPETELCLHLSPGTPAMAAVWLLLGKTRRRCWKRNSSVTPKVPSPEPTATVREPSNRQTAARCFYSNLQGGRVSLTYGIDNR